MIVCLLDIISMGDIIMVRINTTCSCVNLWFRKDCLYFFSKIRIEIEKKKKEEEIFNINKKNVEKHSKIVNFRSKVYN